MTDPSWSSSARMLRKIHSSIGALELGCLFYFWGCALTRRRDRWPHVAIAVLLGEGVALLVAKGCPMGVFQRRAGDDVPMFELWFGPRSARMAIPSFTTTAAAGLMVADARRPLDAADARSTATFASERPGTRRNILGSAGGSLATASSRLRHRIRG